MNCAAIELSKSLVNAEGIHLVEHILLRPRCYSDCKCEFYSRRCNTGINCDFEAPEFNSDDICDDEEPPIRFIPGVDPFSFIATLVLPAWPQRFRKVENRKLIELMLQREVPAHILLRVLWLTTHDICTFDTYFKK